MSLTKDQQSVLNLLGASIWTKMPSEKEFALTEKSARILYAQRVGTLCFSSLRNVKPENENAEKYLTRSLLMIKFYERNRAALEEVTEILRKGNLLPVTLKGFAAAFYYPNPSYRAMGDLDIFVLDRNDIGTEINKEKMEKSLEKAIALLVNDGWEKEEASEKHITLRKGKIDLEIHRHFGALTPVELSRKRDEFTYRELSSPSYKSFTGIMGNAGDSVGPKDCVNPQSSVNPEDNKNMFASFSTLADGLILLSHTEHHLYFGLGIRQLIDFAGYAHAVLSDSYWEETFRPLISAFSLETLAKALIKTAKMYLQMPSVTVNGEPITWCDDISDTICENLIEATLQGDRRFGWADHAGTTETRIITNEIRGKGFFRTARDRGLVTWKAAKKHPILKPLAPVYQIGRWMVHALSPRYGGLKSIPEGLSGNKERWDFLNSLKLPVVMDKEPEDFLSVRLSTPKDLPRLLEIYDDARAFMKETGNPLQWGDVHPPKEIISEDTGSDHGFVVTNTDGEVIGAFAFYLGEDPTYQVIREGKWLNDEPYGTIHRVAAKKGYHGILKAALSFAETRIDNIRIDTHADNKVMQHLLNKYGFTRCGIIDTWNGDERIAFQKKVR